MNNYKQKNNSGYAILETVLYLLLFVFLSIAIINSIITMTRSFKEVAVNRDLLEGSNLMEKISREIKQADSIVYVNNTSLKINSEDENGNPDTKTFTLSSDDVNFFKNDVLVGNLNSSDLIVSDLLFTGIGSPSFYAIKIYFRVSSANDSSLKTKDFYNTVLFRGSY